MNINYADSCNFKPIPAITPLDGYWQNGTWKFGMSEISAGASSQPSWIDVILKGNTALTLVNAKENSLEYLKLFGGTEQLSETYIDSVTAEGKCEQNGTPTPSSPVDIYCNNGVIKLNNVHNIATDTLGAYISKSTGTISSFTGYGYTDYIPVTAGQVFKITQRGTSTTDADGVNQYNSNKVWQSGQSISALGGTYTVPNGISYISLNFNMTYQQFVIEDGIYVDGTTETITDNQGNVATCTNLLSVDSYKDTQEILSGTVTRNIGIKIMTGDETFQSGTNGWISEDTITNNLKDVYTPICTHFGGTDTTPTADSNTVRVYYTSQNVPRVYFGVDKTIYTSAEVFKQFLADQYAQGTPVIIVYPLETATTESVTGQVLNKTPLTYAGSVSGLTGTAVTSSHTTPTPTQPLQLNCNNGVVKHNGLPEGYTRVEYIQSSGTQYIDTGISGNATIKITAQASTIKGSSQALLSSTPTAQGGTWFGEFTTNQKWGIGSGDGLSTIAPTTKMTAELTFNGSGCSGTINNESVTRSATITQGAWTIGAGVSGTTLNYPFSGKIWECQITQNNTIVRNFIPCKNPSNVIGMYDTVSKTFFGNSGTGDFVASTTEYPYIYTDGTTEKVEVHTKNLFDEQWNRNTGTSTSQATWGQVVYASGWSTSSLIPVKAGQQYTVSYNTVVQIYVFYYEADGTMQQSYDTTSATKKTFTVPDGATHIRLQVNKSTEAAIAALETQLELGSTATTYEPYFNGGTATAEMLLKIGNYKDTQEVLSGSVTRNVGIKVLDGTETWNVAISTTHAGVNRNNFYMLFDDATATGTDAITCSIASWAQTVVSDYSAPTCRISNTKNFNIVPFEDMTTIPNVASWKQYLAQQYANGTPVIVVYPLATATTESVTGQPLTIQAGTNIVEITEASMDNLELEVMYKAGVEVTITEIENAQLDNSVEVTIQ